MKVSFLQAAALLIAGLPAAAQAASLTTDGAVSLAAKQVEKDGLYRAWMKPGCMQFMVEDTSADFVEMAIHEKHGGACPGDPATFPVVDRFRVNRKTRVIEWDDVISGEVRPYAELKKSRLK